MGFLAAFAGLGAAAVLAAAVLVVLASIHFDAANSEVPPGLERPARLRLAHALLVGASLLGRILENLHICTQLQFVRFLKNRRRQRRDSTLFFKDAKFKHVPVRIYQPKVPSAGRRRGIVYFHGGWWVFGSIRTHDNICQYLARESESVVVSVEYRLAPEHTYPAPLNDCLAAASHFLEAAEEYGVDKTRIVVAGDSAGGNLAASVCQALASKPGLVKVRAQILIYPLLQGVDFNLPSYQQNQAVPFSFRARTVFFCLQYLNGDPSPLEEVLKGSHVPAHLKLHYKRWLSADHIPREFKARGYAPSAPAACKDDVYEAVKSLSTPEFSPLLAEDAVVRLLPETFILTCEYDGLRDDGLLYKKRLEDQGVRVVWCHLAHGFHGIISLFDGFPSGKKGLEDIVTFVKSL
uniref:Arylacetamide deacetylase-like 4 n=1 Tax=Pogona vitticeps TaxID=103695 RepID=A0ABM5EL79_9SAUR